MKHGMMLITAGLLTVTGMPALAASTDLTVYIPPLNRSS